MLFEAAFNIRSDAGVIRCIAGLNDVERPGFAGRIHSINLPLTRFLVGLFKQFIEQM